MKTIDYSEAVEKFQDNGYIIFRNAIKEKLISRVTKDFEKATQKKVPLLATDPQANQVFIKDIPKEAIWNYRVVDLEKHIKSSHNLILHPVITEFFSKLFNNSPTCIQTLTYLYSSQQAAHSDLHLVSPSWLGPYNRSTLAAAWIALEKADSTNGNLIVYPKSHKILNKKRLDTDFDNNYQDYVDYLLELCQKNNCEPEPFNAEPGDVLIWHGDFVHAGGKIEDPSKTRFSLVAHYCNHPKKVGSLTENRKRIFKKTGSLFV